MCFFFVGLSLSRKHSPRGTFAILSLKERNEPRSHFLFFAFFKQLFLLSLQVEPKFFAIWDEQGAQDDDLSAQFRARHFAAPKLRLPSAIR